MAVSKSSLSAGELIYTVLKSNPEVSARVLKVYPVVDESEATLPYIVYRRVQFDKGPVKGQRGPDTAYIEVECYTKDYTEGVELAEAVRDALDGRQYSFAGLVMRACDLTDSSEDWAGDAYVQSMTFACRM